MRKPKSFLCKQKGTYQADESILSRGRTGACAVHCIDSQSSLVSMSISCIYLVSVVEEAGLSLSWSGSPKIDYPVTLLVQIIILMCFACYLRLARLTSLCAVLIRVQITGPPIVDRNKQSGQYHSFPLDKSIFNFRPLVGRV